MVFPARAGMSPPSDTRSRVRQSFPRPRGDEPRKMGAGTSRRSFSPPARG